MVLVVLLRDVRVNVSRESDFERSLSAFIIHNVSEGLLTSIVVERSCGDNAGNAEEHIGG